MADNKNMPVDNLQGVDKAAIIQHTVDVVDKLKFPQSGPAKTVKDRSRKADNQDGADKTAYEKAQPPSKVRYSSFASKAAQVANDLTGGDTTDYAHVEWPDFEDHPLIEAWRSADVLEAMGATVEVNEDALAEGNQRSHRVTVHVHDDRRHQARTFRCVAESPEDATEKAKKFYKANNYTTVKVLQALPESFDLVEGKHRDATPEEGKMIGKLAGPLRTAVKKNMNADGTIKDFGTHHDLVVKHEQLLQKHGFFVNKGKLRKRLDEETELDEARHLPHMTAQWRANKLDDQARKEWESNGKTMTPGARRKVRASDRYTRLARGKKAFKESVDLQESSIEHGFQDHVQNHTSWQHFEQMSQQHAQHSSQHQDQAEHHHEMARLSVVGSKPHAHHKAMSQYHSAMAEHHQYEAIAHQGHSEDLRQAEHEEKKKS